jgi:hypothetical protein
VWAVTVLVSVILAAVLRVLLAAVMLIFVMNLIGIYGIITFVLRWQPLLRRFEKELTLVHDKLCRFFGYIKYNPTASIVVVGHFPSWMPVCCTVCVRMCRPVAIVVHEIVLAGACCRANRRAG